MFQVKIINALGIVYDLTADPRFSVINVDGLNPPPVSINTSANAGDGSTFNSAYIQGRNIVITVVFKGDIETTRKAFYKIIPIKKPLTFVFANKNREVKIEGYAETVNIPLFSQRQQAQVSIVCPESWLEIYTPIDYEFGYELTAFEAPFAIELGDPAELSTITDHPSVLVANVGDIEVGFVLTVRFSGNVTGLKLQNETTGDFYSLNYTFQNGDILTLDTRRGKLAVKRTRSGITINLLQYMTDGSRWIKLRQGVNQMGITATAGLPAVTAEMSVGLLYGGV